MEEEEEDERANSAYDGSTFVTVEKISWRISNRQIRWWLKHIDLLKSIRSGKEMRQEKADQSTSHQQVVKKNTGDTSLALS